MIDSPKVLSQPRESGSKLFEVMGLRIRYSAKYSHSSFPKASHAWSATGSVQPNAVSLHNQQICVTGSNGSDLTG